MDPSFDPQKPQTISWWIASLAASIIICTGFAGYVFDIKEDLDNAKIRADIMEQRIDMMNSEVDNLRRHVLMQQIPAAAEKAAPAVAPLPAAQPVGTAPPPQPLPPSPLPPKQ